jgi:ferredoxin
VHALEKEGDALPRPKINCTNCLRCVAVCPTDAMRHMIGFRPYRSEEAALLQRRFATPIDLEKPTDLL